jgi:RNA polymerase primary sigma factor
LDYRFSTYATKWIRHEISRYLIYHGQLIRVPAHTAERIRKVELARQALIQENGREPSLHQIADRCEIPEAKVRELIHLNPETCSLDAPAGDDDGTLGVLLENVLAEQPYETLVREELSHILRELMAALDERQQKLLRLRFGLEDGKCYSLEQIGKLLGVSKERARQIEKQAIDKLHKAGTDVGLEDFLE